MNPGARLRDGGVLRATAVADVIDQLNAVPRGNYAARRSHTKTEEVLTLVRGTKTYRIAWPR